MPRPTFFLPVVKPSDRRLSAAAELQRVMDAITPDICKEMGVEVVLPPKEGEVNTTSNLAPRRRVELD